MTSQWSFLTFSLLLSARRLVIVVHTDLILLLVTVGHVVIVAGVRPGFCRAGVQTAGLLGSVRGDKSFVYN